jgi:hypothetical protein
MNHAAYCILMAIEELDIEFPMQALPAEVVRLIEASDRRWDQFFANHANHRFPRLIPSDPALVYSALACVTQQELPPGRLFCEWGSGFGTATCLAALLGYEAYGIELHAELADISREMARELALPVEILCTSYIPEGYDSYAGIGGDDLIQSPMFSYPEDADERALRYDGMACTIAEIDLFFVYPWPEEQELMQKLFDAVAMEGAILIAYHSAKEICVFRKMFEVRDRLV